VVLRTLPGSADAQRQLRALNTRLCLISTDLNCFFHATLTKISRKPHAGMLHRDRGSYIHGTEDIMATVNTHRGPLQGRFMRRLSIGVKLWAAILILAVPLLGLGLFYVNSLTSTLWFTRAEQDGSALARPLLQMYASVIRHGELQGVALVLANGQPDESQALLAQAEQQLSDFKMIETRLGNAATHALVPDLASKWSTLRAANPANAQQSLQLHAAVLDAIATLTGQVTADWQLILDPELAAYNIIDVASLKLPDATRSMAEARVRLAVSVASGEFRGEQAFQISVLSGLLADRLSAARAELAAAAAVAKSRPKLASALQAIGSDWSSAAVAWVDGVSKELSAGHSTPQSIRALLTSSQRLTVALTAAQLKAHLAADTALELRGASQARTAYIALSGSAIALVLAVVLTLLLVRRIAGAVKRLLGITIRIADGHYDNRIDETGQDEISRLYCGIAQMQRKMQSQIAAERAQAIENGRIRAALDNVSGNVMVADEGGTIIYTNPAVESMLRGAEGDLRKELPGFDSARLRGQGFEVLLKKSAGQLGRLQELRTTQVTQLEIGGRTFRLTANPVVAEGSRIGSVVEWVDRTIEVGVEKELQTMLAAVLGGDLDRRIAMQGKTGFFESMSRGINQLTDNMADIVGKVKAAAAEVHRGSEEISQGNIDLSRRTEGQAAALEQTAASMEQMTSTVKQNAENAGQANQLARAARDRAEEGGGVVRDAVEAMSHINDSSAKIVDIIAVIDEIAFQTNLLALNAAVEAARAGEHGRGFAVVATEVRALAGRSASAAQEIKGLIQDSVKRVEDGSALVARSGQTLESIVSAVKKVSDIIAEMAAASKEQSAGIEQVNQAVMDMDTSTQQNAALVEQATAASRAMADQARRLNELMARFQVSSAGSYGSGSTSGSGFRTAAAAA